MANRTAAPESGSKAKRTGKKAEKPKPKTEVEVVQGVLNSIEEKLGKSEIKATLGDFIRLLQLRRELEEDEPREVDVRWIEPSENNEA